MRRQLRRQFPRDAQQHCPEEPAHEEDRHQRDADADRHCEQVLLFPLEPFRAIMPQRPEETESVLDAVDFCDVRLLRRNHRLCDGCEMVHKQAEHENFSELLLLNSENTHILIHAGFRPQAYKITPLPEKFYHVGKI